MKPRNGWLLLTQFSKTLTLTVFFLLDLSSIFAKQSSPRSQTNLPPSREHLKESSSKDQTQIDLQGSDVLGERKLPLGSLIEDKGQGTLPTRFMQARTHWRFELEQSLRGLR